LRIDIGRARVRRQLLSSAAAGTGPYWELLAAAAGDQGAASAVAATLTRDSIGLAFDGLGITPDISALRVDALAARDPDLVRKLAGRWPKPTESFILTAGDAGDFWLAVWVAAIRFLNTTEIDRLKDEHAPLSFGVESERMCVRTSLVRTFDTVFDMTKFIIDNDLDYNQSRRLDRARICSDQKADERVISEMVFGSTAGAAHRLHRLRAFLHRTGYLSPKAIEVLQEIFDEAVRSEQRLPRNFAVLTNVMAFANPSSGFWASVGEYLCRRSGTGVVGLREVLPIAFLVAGENWSVP